MIKEPRHRSVAEKAKLLRRHLIKKAPISRICEEARLAPSLFHSRARFPDARPRIIFANAPQFIAKDFKAFIRISGMTQVRTPPYCAQSNGKPERWNKSIKGDCIRPGVPLSPEDTGRLIAQYVAVYNEHRLHSALGYRVCSKAVARTGPAQPRCGRRKRTKEIDSGLTSGSRLADRHVSGKTEAGSAGTQPAEG